MVFLPERYTVFEVVNERRREIFVAATSEPIFTMTDALRRRPPEPIKAWDMDDVKTIRSIEFDMSAADARSFIETYVRTSLPPGWRYLTEKKPGTAGAAGL